MGFIVMILTFLISIFAFSNIFGSIIYKVIKEKRIEYLITVIIWILILYGYYRFNVNVFSNYLNFYKISTIVSAILSLLSLQNK